MGYKLKILSPVHIGAGEQLNGLNFIIDNKKMYMVEPEAILNLLGPEKGLKFAQWLENHSNEIDRPAQEYKHKSQKDRRSGETEKIYSDLRKKPQNFTLKAFVEKEKLITLEQLKSKAAYSIPVQENVYKDSKIFPFIKQTCSPYIPGTEIKGAVRTAILYCAVKNDEGLRNWIEESFEKMCNEATKEKQGETYMDLIKAVRNQKKPDLIKKKKEKLVERAGKIESELQEKILNCHFEKPDAKYDVMKFFQVGDTDLLNAGSSLMVSFARPFNMSNNKFKVFYEYLLPGILVSLTSFKLEDNHSRIKKLDLMKFTEPHKQLMRGLNFILSYCYQFTADLLEEEIAYYTKHDKKKIVEHLQGIQKLNTIQSPVLRIGKDEGFNSLTIGLAVKKLMPKLYENVLIHATKNKSYDSSITGDKFYFPKSRKIVHWDGRELTPGWVQLIPGEIRQPAVKSHQDKEGLIHKQPGSPVDLSALSDKFGRKEL